MLQRPGRWRTLPSSTRTSSRRLCPRHTRCPLMRRFSGSLPRGGWGTLCTLRCDGAGRDSVRLHPSVCCPLHCLSLSTCVVASRLWALFFFSPPFNSAPVQHVVTACMKCTYLLSLPCQVRGVGSDFAEAQGSPLSWRQDITKSGTNTLAMGIFYEALQRHVAFGTSEWRQRPPGAVHRQDMGLALLHSCLMGRRAVLVARAPSRGCRSESKSVVLHAWPGSKVG
jgi:hypothetical protein